MSKGFDNKDINKNLLLDLQMKEGVGTVTRDWAKPHHTDPTLTGAPSWVQGGVSGKLNYLDFNSGNPDFIEIAALDSTDLDFTSEDFSVALWVYPDSIGGDIYVLSRGDVLTDGWVVLISTGTRFLLRTNQAGDTKQARGIGLVIGDWNFIVLTRDGTTGIAYHNGINTTDFVQSLTNPVTANRKLLFGVEDDESSNPFDGKIYRPRIWERALSADEIKFIYESERGLFGV